MVHLRVPREEIDAMPVSVFRGWQYLEQLEPFGERRLDFLGGMIAAALRNMLAPGGSEAVPQHFIPEWDPEPNSAPMTADQATRLKADHDRFLHFKQGYERQHPEPTVH